MICGENDINILINIFNERIIYCYNNYYIKHKCYLKNSILNQKYSCNICEKNFLYNHNDLNYINISYINCLESKEDLNYTLNYSLNETDLKNIYNKNETVRVIIDNLINEFNMSEIKIGKDKKIEYNNELILLTSTFNQNTDENNITINLCQCENILKEKYNISYNDSLYILMMLTYEEGMKIPKVDYEVFYPLYNTII